MGQMSQEAKEILSRQDQLEQKRVIFEAQWREIAERVLPRQDDFQKQRAEGTKRMQFVFDSTPILALDRYASAMDSLITPIDQVYQKLIPGDEALYGNLDVQTYLDEVTKIIFRERYRPQANFANQVHESYMSLGAFGTQGLFVEDYLGQGPRYKSIPLVELFVSENSWGVIDLTHRKFDMTVRQAMDKFGDQCPEQIRRFYKENRLFEKFTFLHACWPNPDFKPGKLGEEGMRIRSRYLQVDSGEIVGAGGYRSMPYIVSRGSTSPREVYGWSPAMIVLPDIKMLNEMAKTILRAAHKVTDPPILAYGDGLMSAFQNRPNAVNYGAINDQGRALVQPFESKASIPIGFEMMEERRKIINDAFLISLFQILVDHPEMTATEAMLRAQEKGQLLTPTMGRQQSELVGPMTVREIDILSAARIIPPPPDELVEAGRDAWKIEYTSPLSHLRRATDSIAILNTIEQLAPLAEHDPSVYDIFEPQEIGRELSDINGVPAKVLRSRERVAQIQAEKQQAQQTANVLQLAQAAASASKDAGAAAQNLGLVPSPLAANG